MQLYRLCLEMERRRRLSVCFQLFLRIATLDALTPAGFSTKLPQLDDRYPSLSMSSVSVPAQAAVHRQPKYCTVVAECTLCTVI